MSECCDYTAEEVVEHDAESPESTHFVYEEDEHPPIPDQGAQGGEDLPEEEASKEEGAVFINTFFQEGSLGVNLHRRPTDGIVTVIEIVPGSQAIGLDIKVGDEIWAIGTNELGHKFLDRETWQSLVGYIKQSARPLQVTWRRPDVPTIPFIKSRGSSPVPAATAAERPSSPPVPDRLVSSERAPSPVLVSPPVIESQPAVVEQEDEPEEEEPVVPQVSPTYKVLEALLATLVKKPSHPKDSVRQDFAFNHLLNNERRVLRRGDLTTPGAPTLWMKTSITKHVILLTDMLIIAVPVKIHKLLCYQVEHMIDLQACKLRSEGQVFRGGLVDAKAGPGSASPPPAKPAATDAARAAADTAFQIIWPGGSLELFAESKEVKEVWVLNLFLAICARVGGESGGEGQVLGWRHQYMLGTMHSAVLSHDEARVRELVALCDIGEMEFSTCIDAVDEDGYTPLHYACIMRMHGIIRALHEAAADVTAQDHRGLTPLHWAAMQLDDYTLSLLCSHVFDLDLTDKHNRTPLYMACVEGRDISGHTDNAALKKCVACMLTHQPNINFYDQDGYTMLHYLSASWQYETAELLLQADADVNARCAVSGQMPLHLACQALPIKLAEGEAKRIMQGTDLHHAEQRVDPAHSLFEKLNHPFGPATLRTLLKAGARPNAKDSKGRTALHILAEPGRDDLWDLMELTDAVAVLVSFGARFDESGALHGLKSRMLGVSVDALVERWASLPVINADALNLTLGCFKQGGDGSSSSSKIPHAASTESSSSSRHASHSPATSTGHGGKSKKSVVNLSYTTGHPAPAFPPDTPDKCSMCWFQFSLFKRAHHCRLCDSLCCDECSKKRCLLEYSQARTCDSCYNRVMDLQERKNRDDLLSKIKPVPRAANSNASKQFLENRSKLLAEAEESKSGENGSGGIGSARRSNNNTSQTMASLNETHEKLVERGEKLSKLAESSNLMASQANDFAKMAKLLNEQQKSRWF